VVHIIESKCVKRDWRAIDISKLRQLRVRVCSFTSWNGICAPRKKKWID